MPVGACPCAHCATYWGTRQPQYRPAVLVETSATVLLLDLGPDIRQQVIEYGIRHIDAVFVIHAHRDHFGGLPELALLKYSGLETPPVYANQGVRDHAHRYFDWVKADIVVTEYGRQYRVGDLTVTCIEGFHGEHFECSIITVDDGAHRLLYMPDTRTPRDPASWHGVRFPAMAITDGSYAFGPLVDPLEVVEPAELDDSTHPSTGELNDIWSHLQAGSVYLMHVSEHFTQLTLSEMAERLPPHVYVAQDGAVVELG